MARMYPNFINPDVKSSAERRLFEEIKNSKELKDFACLHSLGLSRHMWKKQGEIDFVFVGNGFVLCLEVKGGRIKRKDGVWCFIDRFGRVNKKAESPFAQASSGMFSLKNNIESKFGHTGLVFGYGVLTPDVKLDIESPEWDQHIVYDQQDTGYPIEKYIERLSKYWKNKVGNQKTTVKSSDIVKYLRGDFELAVPLWTEIQDAESEMVFFSSEQYRALDQMESNPRIIFSGGAGSGKTMLAVERARRSAFSGKRVLLLCYNKLLGAKLENEIQNFGETKNLVHAESIHKFFMKNIVDSGLTKELEDKAANSTEKELYDQYFSELFIEAIEKLDVEKFDILILDEGQDLLSENYLLALDCILKGGMKEGKWTVFLDPGAQARLFNRFSKESYEYLRSLGAPEYRLDLNCRNTVQIATQASVVSGFPTGNARVQGPKVEYITYKSETDQALEIVDLVNCLVEKEEIPPGSITILSTRNKDRMSLVTSGVKLPKYFAELNEKNIVSNDKGSTFFGSVQSYKGLENNVIIYCDVDKLNDDWIESVNYVGMTRPREKLYVFINKKVSKDHEARILNYAANQK